MSVLEAIGAPGEARADGELTTHSVVRGAHGGVAPLALVRDAVGELVRHDRGIGWHVAVREVAVLRVFRPPADGEPLTTTVTCHPAGDDELVVSGRCECDSDLVATITARLTVRREA